MIYLTSELPFIIDENDNLSEIDSEELISQVVCAANLAGYGQWWLADHVTESVLTYLRHGYSEERIKLSELQKLLRSALQVVGYGDVADLLELKFNECKVSLLDLANRADCGYELAFFQLLEERVKGAMASDVHRLELFDLEHCIKKLRSAKTWNRRCETLQSEIVAYVRSHCLTFSKSNEVRLMLR
jgi:hypothetical protein